MCVCVCVLVYATLWGPNVTKRIVKPDIFDTKSPVGTSLRSPRGKIYIYIFKIVNYVYLKCNNTNRFSVTRRFRVRG